ncbi:MAG: hypothetical protein Ta2F_04850 [Termitinemataceae bacterium]|nr:MAG: hypothetical protein Ta2F_04850 [Termitinemataceae bacterium]
MPIKPYGSNKHYGSNKTFALFLFFMFFVTFSLFAQANIDKMRDTIHYGTDSEITALLKTLKTDKNKELDDDLIKLAKDSSNDLIVNGLFTYFTDSETSGLEDKALELLQNREDENTTIILAAIDYLGSVKEKKSKDVLLDIISKGEDALLKNAVRSLGKISNLLEGGSADQTAEYLIEFYKDKSPKEDESREIILAIGNTGSKKASEFLMDIITNADESAYLKTSALQAAAKIKDPSALDTVLTAAKSTEAGVRSAAVEALGSFEGNKAEEAIIDAFRDSFFRSRLAAVKAAGTLKLSGAIPYLRYRALNDDAASVREESIKVLSEIGTSEANNVLLSILDDKQINDKTRVLCANALLKTDASKYCDHIVEMLDESKQKKFNALYAGLLKALASAKTPKLQDLTARLYNSKDVTDNAIALDITANNDFKSFKDQVEKISETKNSTLSAKAAKILKDL